ncbi:hypothetical protein [Deinococcus sp. 6GRE01]|uniref:hypothetical protein n=1 Tax=Deinococcus sp. 6GRE01 TaxID=2745873 RepID=UPI001E4A0E68|nr:hypothetical protein [Deinococcus sp. 6GRE01]
MGRVAPPLPYAGESPAAYRIRVRRWRRQHERRDGLTLLTISLATLIGTATVLIACTDLLIP